MEPVLELCWFSSKAKPHPTVWLRADLEKNFDMLWGCRHHGNLSPLVPTFTVAVGEIKTPHALYLLIADWSAIYM